MTSPVITKDASGCRVAVAHGKNGFLISVESVDRLVYGMGAFADDISLVDKIGLQARLVAERSYDVHAVNREILKVIDASLS